MIPLHPCLRLWAQATLCCAATAWSAAPPIDREAVVTRHRVVLTAPDPGSPLSVGNGAFCFTADITGLQTFEQDYAKGVPLGTMADWAWHEFPNPDGFKLEDALVGVPGADGRTVPYPIGDQSPAGQWLRANPHRFSLGQLGLVLRHPDGREVPMADLTAVQQTLDPWRGHLASRFNLDGQTVEVSTCALHGPDGVAVRIASPLLAMPNRLSLRLAFPYPSGSWGKTFNDPNAPDRHRTDMVREEPGRWTLRRALDATTCTVVLAVTGASARRNGAHEILIEPAGPGPLEVALAFAPGDTVPPLAAAHAPHLAAAAAATQAYWRSGGVIDLSRSTDPRWRELERRTVLSQYLTAIQSRGRTCPAETGLTVNSWHGKFHLEMHWWHSVHFALWGRPEVLARQMEWYLDRMPVMRENARRQGYAGVRWGKMLGPDGRESPSGVGPLLLWQQPHPIYYAELLRRANPARESWAKYAPMVEETAAFMAAFAHRDEGRGCFDLGPPFISAREFGARDHRRNRNGAFELAYWRWGLETANAWRQRLGQPPNPDWQRIASQLAPLPVADGRYIEQEQLPVPDGGHPCQLAPMGFLPPSPAVDEATMRRTMDHVLHRWNHESTWGWDYPLMALTAARLGRGDWAIESLLLPQTKNTYRANGHNFQSDRLPLYLPGNGGLLTAMAMMAAGWDGAPDRPAPGFPADGTWDVRWEGLARMP